jgi:hypothetical protein
VSLEGVEVVSVDPSTEAEFCEKCTREIGTDRAAAQDAKHDTERAQYDQRTLDAVKNVLDLKAAEISELRKQWRDQRGAQVYAMRDRYYSAEMIFSIYDEQRVLMDNVIAEVRKMGVKAHGEKTVMGRVYDLEDFLRTHFKRDYKTMRDAGADTATMVQTLLKEHKAYRAASTKK